MQHLNITHRDQRREHHPRTVARLMLVKHPGKIISKNPLTANERTLEFPT